MENFFEVGFLESPNLELEETRVDKDHADEDCEVLVEEPKKKRQKKRKSKEVKEVKVEEDESKRNWLDSEMESLITLKGEMQPDFIQNAKKQGVDMWLKLHNRLLSLQPNFKNTPKACKSKFNDLYKAYKDDKLANNISGESRHTCKFYDAMDSWYHQNGSVLKHVSASTVDLPDSDGETKQVKGEFANLETPSLSRKGKSSTKIKYQESALELMGQMVENSKDMARSIKEANAFMSNLDKHMERLIEKL